MKFRQFITTLDCLFVLVSFLTKQFNRQKDFVKMQDSFSYSNSSNTAIMKKLCKSKKLVKSQSGHTEKPFADH